MATEPVDVLVVGAGTSGLSLALQAHDHGAHVRVVEGRPEEFRPSRAMVMHPRTLEVLRPLGVTDALLERADTSPAVQLHLGRRVVPVRVSDLDLPDTAFPHLTLIRQADVEAVLAAALAERGVEVERGTALVDGSTTPDRARATLHRDGAVEEVDCHHLAGCDGPASTVRGAAGIGWGGAPYAQEVVLADVELDGDVTPGLAHVVAGRRGLVFLFNIGERATWRLLATQPAGADPLPFGQPGPPVPVAELQTVLATAGLPATITHVAWSARVRLQHRLATAMRRDRLYLVGDAAHAHSPAAAQGMNTGIQDATNLGWKLALAARAERQHGVGTQTLLDSYERERWPVARLVLAATHATFWAEAGTDPLAGLARSRLAPLGAPLIPVLLRQRRLVAEGVRLLSGFRVSYRSSPLSLEDAPVVGGPHAGDRLPDETITCHGRRTRLHDLTAVPGTHVLLQRDAAPISHADLGQPGPAADTHPSQRPGAHLHRVTSMPGHGVVVVRPDGYVGYRSGEADPTLIRDWLVLAGECHG